jgi:nickel/cobalt exporter
VIGGYGAASNVTAARLSWLALGASLAQAVAAIVLVYAAALLLGWGRAQMTGLADDVLAPFSYALIGAVGLWLLIRGIRHLKPTQHNHDVCGHCGHAHGPTPEQSASVTSVRDALVLIGSIAVRPCTGALFLLILTWRFGVDYAGIIGALIMGLGTASVTIMVAVASVGFRESTLRVINQAGLARAGAWLEICAGGIVVILASQLVLRAL